MGTTVATIVTTLWLGFWQLYFQIGWRLAQTNIFEQGGTDVLFGADSPRVVLDLAVFDSKHNRAILHPLFVFLLNPIGTVLTAFTHSPITTALLMTSCMGGLAVALCFYYFCVLGVDRVTSLLLAGVFGVTTSQLIFSSVPEIFAFAACTIVTSHLLVAKSVRQGAVSVWEWIAAGLLTLGVTTTNVLQTWICMVSAEWRERSQGYRRLMRRSAVVVMSTFAIVLAFNVLQREGYGTRLFVSPDVLDQRRYVKTSALRNPKRAIRDTVQNMVIRSAVAPTPTVLQMNRKRFPTVSFGPPSALGMVTAAAWLALLGVGVMTCLVAGKFLTPQVVAGTASLLFNVSFHNFWGVREKFLYSGHYTFLLFIFLWPLCALKPVIARLGLGILLVLMMANNGLFMWDIIQQLTQAMGGVAR